MMRQIGLHSRFFLRVASFCVFPLNRWPALARFQWFVFLFLIS